jgi:hypothetical protein
VTTRTPVFDEAGSREDGADLGEMRSGLFLPRNLDDPNRVELADEIRSLAQRVSAYFLVERRATVDRNAHWPCQAISFGERASQTNCRRLMHIGW